MRVCLVTPVYPCPESGVYPGIERNISEFTHALQSQNINVEVLTTFWNGGEDGDDCDGVRIHRIPDTSHHLGRLGRLFDSHILSFSLLLRTRVKLFERCDITHAFMPLAGTNWIHERTPLVTTFHHDQTASGLRDLLYLPVHHRVEWHAYSTSDHVVVPSTASQKELVEHFNVHPDTVSVIPHGVNNKVFTPTSDKQPNRFRVLFVGPLEERKNVPVLIRAVAKATEEISSLQLDIVGSGPARDELEAIVSHCGIEGHTTFHGFVPDDDLISLYQRADVFGFPSLKEGFGMVMIEAMACGTPVIAPEESPFGEVVGDAGILTSRDPKSFATALISVASNRERLSSLQKKAIDRASRQFDWVQTAEEHLAIYSELIAE